MRDSELQTVVGGAAVVAGIGTLSFMLFPLALPALILLGLAALPVIPLLIAGALILLPVRALRRRRRHRAAAAPAPAVAARPRTAQNDGGGDRRVAAA